MWQGEWEERSEENMKERGLAWWHSGKKFACREWGPVPRWEDSTRHGAAKPVGHSHELALYCSRAVGPRGAAAEVHARRARA